MDNTDDKEDFKVDDVVEEDNENLFDMHDHGTDAEYNNKVTQNKNNNALGDQMADDYVAVDDAAVNNEASEALQVQN